MRELLALLLLAFAALDGPHTPAEKVVARARGEVTAHVAYEASYQKLTFKDGVDTGRFVYPGGDRDLAHGVCTDLVVRAVRAGGIDLQERLHQDILAHPEAHPEVKSPDANIDHRRVGPLKAYFEHHATRLPKGFGTDEERASWHAGDVVIWAFRPCPACTPDHMGIVSDQLGSHGLPLVLHNIGPLPTEDDNLSAWTVLGHYRLWSDQGP